jgi:hypothetical protein
MIAKAFKNAPISDFHDERLVTALKNDINGYTWGKVFSGCLKYEDKIAVPLNMPPAMVLFPLCSYRLTPGKFNLSRLQLVWNAMLAVSKNLIFCRSH